MSTETHSTLNLKDIADGSVVGFANPRERMDAADLKSLAADIAAHGLRNPLQVWPTKTEDGKAVNVLIGGYRRRKAIELLVEAGQANGLASAVPVHYIAATSLVDARYHALSDNIQRSDLSSYELAQEIARLKEAGEKQIDIAKRLAKSNSWVSRKLSAYDSASKALKSAWKAGKLPDETVEALSELSEEEQTAAVAESLSTREAGGRKGKSQARKKNKKRAQRVQRAGTKEVQDLIAWAEDAPKDLRYVRGMHDALAYTLGAIEIDGFDKEWKSFYKAAVKQAEADAEAATEEESDAE